MNENEKQNMENNTTLNNTNETNEVTTETSEEIVFLEENASLKQNLPLTGMENNSFNETHLESANPSVETFSNQTVTPLKKGKKRKGKIIIPILLILIFLCAISYAIYYFLNSNSKRLLVKSLEVWEEDIETLVKPIKGQSYKLDWDAMTEKAVLNLKVTSPYIEVLKENEETKSIATIIENLNQTPITLDVQADLKNKKGMTDISITKNNESIFNVHYVNQDKKQYILLKEVFEKYLQLEEEQEIFTEQTQADNIDEEVDYVWDVMKKSVEKNLKEDYITKENQKLKVDGKDVNTTKVTLVLNDKNTSELLKNIVADLKKDKRANEFLVKMYPEFKDYEVELSQDTSDGVLYSVYKTKVLNRIVGISIESNGDVINQIIGKNKRFEIIEDKETLFVGILNETNNGFTLTINKPNDKENSIVIKGKKENDTSTYSFDIKTKEFAVNGNMNCNLKEVKKQEEYSGKIDMNIKVEASGAELATVGFNMDLTMTKGANIEDITESTPMNDLTQEEMSKLEEYFTSFLEKLAS